MHGRRMIASILRGLQPILIIDAIGCVESRLLLIIQGLVGHPKRWTHGTHVQHY
jgi:hypothetical protein